MIVPSIVIVGIAFSMSSLLGYDSYGQTVSHAYARYEQQYGTTFDLSEEEYNLLNPDQQQKLMQLPRCRRSRRQCTPIP